MHKKITYISKIIPRLLTIILLLGLGFFFLFLPTEPGYISNIIAWLETEGSWLAHTCGIVFLFVGIIGILSFTRGLEHRTFSLKKKTLTCSIDRAIFQDVTDKLWTEYFQQNGLETQVSMQKGQLYIRGEIPDGWDNVEDLSNYLSENLFALTGYWGDFSLTVIQKPV